MPAQISRSNSLVGQQFGRLTVVADAPSSRSRARSVCQCSCGNTVTTNNTSLRVGDTQSCGCWNRDKMIGNTYCRKDISGQRFGRLVVLRRSDEKLTYPGGGIRYLWVCRCDCGNIIDRCSENLIPTSCCGCTHGQAWSLPAEEAAFRCLMGLYKTNAKLRHLAWDITDDLFRALVKGDCHYCGDPPRHRFKKKKRSMLANGIDRLNNTMGYSSDNVVSCCKTCNHAKCQMGKDEFLQWVHRVHTHSVKGLATDTP